IWNAIESHHALENPLSLLQFLLIAFADLKTHHFYYWFAFPSVSKYPLIQSLQIRNLSTLYSPADLDCISNLCKEHFREIFFLLHSPSPNNFQYEPLKKIGHVFTKSEKPCIVFSDPSSLPDRAGWPLKNLLALLCYLGYTQATILCCRHDTFTRFTSSKSISLFMELSFSSTTIEKIPNFVGWERSHEGKLAPKFVNLSHMMDPNAYLLSFLSLCTFV
ncbi:Autophagy protein 7, partial [Coelomomyces lativittatus]